MICPKCGADVVEGAERCDQCGISLSEYGIVHEGREDRRRGDRPPGQLNPGLRNKLIVSFIVFDILLAVALIVFFLRL